MTLTREQFVELSGLAWDGRLDIFLKALEKLERGDQLIAVLQWEKARDITRLGRALVGGDWETPGK